MTMSFEHVLRLARQLPAADQERLRTALEPMPSVKDAAQLMRNRAAISMLDAWAATPEEDDGNESWDIMLQHLDKHRESARKLYPNLKTEIEKNDNG